MIRRAFTMRLKPEALAEYKHHHDNIWPELVDEIQRAGIASITTFQRDLDLFLISEIADEAAWDRLWNSEVHKRWAEVMQPLMHLRDDGIVDAGSLMEVFHLTTSAGDNILLTAVPAGEPPAPKRPKRAKKKPASKKASAAKKRPAKKVVKTIAAKPKAKKRPAEKKPAAKKKKAKKRR